MAYDTIIANGTVIGAANSEQADVAIQGEKIAAIGKGLARRRIDLRTCTGGARVATLPTGRAA